MVLREKDVITPFPCPVERIERTAMSFMKNGLQKRKQMNGLMVT